MNLQDFLNAKHPLKDEEWLLPGYIKKGDLSLFGAAPGEGKTWSVLALALHIIYGMEFLGRRVPAGSVLMIDHETTTSDQIAPKIQKITEGIIRRGGKQKGEFDLQLMSPFRLDKQSTWDKTLEKINTLKPVLITFDSLRRMHNQQEKDDHAMQGVVDKIRVLRDICGSTVLVIHHFNKREKGSFFDRLRGSGVIYANSDSACEIRSLVVEKHKMLKSFGIIPQARKHIVHPPMKVEMIDMNENGVEYIWMNEGGEYNPAENPLYEQHGESIVHLILSDCITQEWTFRDIQKAFGGMIGDNLLREVCTSLGKINILNIAPIGNSHLFRYKLLVSSCPWCGKSSGF